MTSHHAFTQASLPGLEDPLLAASESLASQGSVDERGAIFTRSEVVEFILDLCGYTADLPLHRFRLLEPSSGAGDFLLPAIRRLLAAWRTHGTVDQAVAELGDAIRAVELHRTTYDVIFEAVLQLLRQSGIAPQDARALADRWLIRDDFLLTPIHGQFDFVVGNPPYVRQELIPAVLLAEYRRLYRTLYDRADLYVPFMERSLSLLSATGCLAFICSDRWMKNRYGGPLRELIARDFHLRTYVDMTDTPAFTSDVIAYPAITVISRNREDVTRAAYRPQINTEALTRLAKALRSAECELDGTIRELKTVTNGDEPWLLEAEDRTAIIRRLEGRFPLLEDVGCKVGIGVATGADKAFIADYDSLDVELDRKLPLATTRDITSGEVRWQGQGVINPFDSTGKLVDLACYPRLERYLNQRRDTIANRHCAKKSPANWYRTIDRITPALAYTPKLLIPDIKGEAHIVFEEGRLYPHHNLYYVTAESWELRALQAVLLSSISRLFIATYSTKMRGGFLRFQAQYLRRIRIPHWSEVPQSLQAELMEAGLQRDIEACNRATYQLYGLSAPEIAVLEKECHVT